MDRLVEYYAYSHTNQATGEQTALSVTYLQGWVQVTDGTMSRSMPQTEFDAARQYIFEFDLAENSLMDDTITIYLAAKAVLRQGHDG